MSEIIKNFWQDEEGATAIEYGLIAGLIAVGLIASMDELRTALAAFFKSISTKLGSLEAK